MGKKRRINEDVYKGRLSKLLGLVCEVKKKTSKKYPFICLANE